MTPAVHHKITRFGVALLGVTASLGAAMALPAASRSTIGKASSRPEAVTARTVTLNEAGHLRLTSRHNFTLNERGSVSGTIRGVIYVHLTAVSSTHVTVAVEIYPSGGSIYGSGSGTYSRRGTAGSFSGSMSLGRGSGRYTHVHGSGLSFRGTIEESHGDAITVYVTGRVSD